MSTYSNDGLLAAIARNTHKFRSHFKDSANYHDFHDYMAQAIRNPYPHLVEHIVNVLCQHLREVNELAAEKWFRDNWCGERGRYMLAHCAVAVTPNQNGIESSWRWLKAATSDKTLVCIAFFLSALFHYMAEKSKELMSQLLRENISLHAYNSCPRIDRHAWESLQNMHPYTLAMTFVMECSGRVITAWNSVVDEVYGNDYPWSGKHFVQALMAQASTLTGTRIRRLSQGDARCVLIPAQKWFKRFDPDNDKSLRELKDIMHGRAGTLEIAPVDYHSKFIRICQSEDIDALDPGQDYDIDSVTDALDTYHHLNVTDEGAWGCCGMGK